MTRVRPGIPFGMMTVLLWVPSIAGAGEYPCGLRSHSALEVVDWSATFALPHEITVTVAVRMIPEPSAQSIVGLMGNVRFHYPGGGTGKFVIRDPDRPITVETMYVYRQILDGDSNTLPLVKMPKKDIQVFACLAHWTYDNGQTWVAN